MTKRVLPDVPEHLAALSRALTAVAADAGRYERWGTELAATLGRGGRLLVAGNGGSAAAAQHLTAELVGRYVDERDPVSAIALTTDSSTITAVMNDYGPEHVFAR